MVTFLAIAMVTSLHMLRFAVAETQTIYVDDDNMSGPWNGSATNPYQNITSGIQHATVGDTVFVFGGVYHEHINVTKAMSLVGQDSSITIIDGGGQQFLPIININASNVSLENLTVQNTTTSFMDGYGILVWQTTNVTLKNVVATRCNYGVVIRNSSDCRILNSEFMNNFNTAIVLGAASRGNTLVSNTVSGNLVGLYIEDTSSRYNAFYRNNMINNTNHLSIFGTYTIWDNGAEGNYWDTYLGEDIDGDGIGDEQLPHLGVDYHPLVDPWSFTRFYQVDSFEVRIDCNYTVASFNFAESLRQMSFYITGPLGMRGFCNVTVPAEILSPADGSERWIVMFNSNPIAIDTLTVDNSTLVSFSYILQSQTLANEVRLKVGTLYPPTANFESVQDPERARSVNFTDTSTDSPNGTIIWRQWNFGDGSSPIETNETLLTHTFDNKLPYDVTLTVKDVNNLTHSVTKVVWVLNLSPKATFTYEPTELLVGWEIEFNASESFDTDGDIERYFWNFGEQLNITFAETTPLITHVFEHVGVYNSTLRVRDQDGEENSISKLLVVDRGPSTIAIDVPSSVKYEEDFETTATLTNQAGQPLSNAQISFFLHYNSEVLNENGTTDINGLASVSFSLSSIGEFAIDADFSGTTDYYGESATSTILVSPLDTYLSIQIPPNATKKEPLTVVASLQDENGEPVANAEVDFYFNDGNGWVFLGSYLTDQNGVASKSYVPQNVGLHSFKAMFEETEIYSAASSEASLDVFSTDADYSLILVIIISGVVIFLLYLFLKRRKTFPKASSVEKTPSS